MNILSEDPEWRSWTHTSCSMIYIDTFSSLSPGKAQFNYQIVKLAHEILNYLHMYIKSFHYFISFWAILTISYLYEYKSLLAQGCWCHLLVVQHIYYLGFYPLIKGVVELPFISCCCDFVISLVQSCCTYQSYLQHQWLPICLIEQTLLMHWIF